MRNSPARARWPAIALALLLSAGCGTLSFAWNFVDGVLVDRVDEWVDLTSGQRAELERRLDPWLERLARERLPEYSRFLRAVAERHRAGLTVADLEWTYDRLRGHYRALVRDATSAWIAPIVHDIGPAQREHLRERIRTRNREYHEQYVGVPGERRQEAVADWLIDLVEGWTGALNREQIELVRQRVQELPDNSVQIFHRRLRNQAGLLAMLRHDPDAAAVAAYLQAWWTDRRDPDPEQRAAHARFEMGLIELLAELAASLDPRQHSALDRRLRRVAAQLDQIHDKAMRD